MYGRFPALVTINSVHYSQHDLTALSTTNAARFSHAVTPLSPTQPQAFMSMFQILLKKNWLDIMYGTMRKAGLTGTAFVAIYFVIYHLLVTVVSSLDVIPHGTI